MFAYHQKILFKHCDPAGIVFYPRYFEMINDCVEAFFSEVLLYPFEEMHGTHGVPTASITAQFRAPSRHGDQLILTLDVLRMGRTSMKLSITARCDAEIRFEASAVLVHTHEGRSCSWPDNIAHIITEGKNE